MSTTGEEDRDRPGTYRDGIAPAEPEPVTDAMISPRTRPGSSSDPAAGADGRICHVCGATNRSAASYCLQCGSRLRDPSQPPAPAPGHQPADQYTPGPVGPGPGGSDVIGDMADEGWWDPDGDEWSPPAPPPAGAQPSFDEPRAGPGEPVPTGGVIDRRDTVRLAVWGVLGLVALVLILLTFVRSSDDAAPPDTTAAETELAAEMYASVLADLADEVGTLAERATLINERWDGREADFQETLAALEDLAGDVSALAARLEIEDPPPDVSPESHTRLVASAATLERAAADMVDGLKAPDTGELRRAAFTRFVAAAAEFRAVADSLIQLVNVTESTDS